MPLLSSFKTHFQDYVKLLRETTWQCSMQREDMSYLGLRIGQEIDENSSHGWMLVEPAKNGHKAGAVSAIDDYFGTDKPLNSTI